MTIREAEKRLGFWIDELRAITDDAMLVRSLKWTDAIEEKGYDRIVECLENEGYPAETKDILQKRRISYRNEGYPTETSADFKAANVSDFVYTSGPILFDFSHKTERKRLRLVREKEEYVVMDRISVGEEKFVVVMEAKMSSLGETMKQCLLAMEDARGNNRRYLENT